MENEEGTGQGIKERTSCHRLEEKTYSLLQKFGNAGLDYEETLIAFEDSLNKLGLTYIGFIFDPVARNR